MPHVSKFDTHKKVLPDLLEQIDKTKIQLVDMQRDYVWTESQVIGLLATVSLGWTIQAILLLKAQAMTNIKFKPKLLYGVSGNIISNAEYLIMDGQQRTTSLYLSLYRQQPALVKEGRKQKITPKWFYINIQEALASIIGREEAIISVPESKVKRSVHGTLDLSAPENEYESLLFPLSQVFNFSKWRKGFLKYWNHAEDKEDLLEKFEREIIENFKYYSMPVIEVNGEMSRVEVCILFQKVNSGGTELNAFDLVNTMFAAEDFYLGDHYGEIKQQLSHLPMLDNFQNTDWLQAVTLCVTLNRRLNAIEAGVTPLPGFGCRVFDIYSLTLDEYKNFSPIVIDGLKQAAKFVYTLGFQHAKDIPYLIQLTMLATILGIIGKPNSNVRSQLEKWWFTGLFTERYAGNGINHISSDILELYEYLLGNSQPPNLFKSPLFNSQRLLEINQRRGAIYCGLNALLRKNGAVDLLSGEELRHVKEFDIPIECHHIFPKAWCKQASINEKRYNSLINLTPIREETNGFLGGKAPSHYLNKLVSQGISKRQINEALKTHLIDPETLWSDDFEAFFEARTSALQGLIQRVMGR